MTLTMTALWDALGWSVLHSLWQGALVALIVWGVRAAATERRASLRYLAGMVGMAATFGAFLVTFVLQTMQRLETGVAPVLNNTDTVVSPLQETGNLALTGLPTVTSLTSADAGLAAAALVPWLGMIWAVGFLFLGIQAWRAYSGTRFLATQGLHAIDDEWTARFTRLVGLSQASERVRLFVSDHASGPMTLGALKPIVLVPAGFLTGLPSAQVEAILLHELAHIRRHDFLLGLAQTAIRTVLYFNPAVILMSRNVDEDREQACDDIAVRLTGKPGDLARGLAALRLSGNTPALAMGADGGPLMARLNRLMGRPVSQPARHRLTAAAISALMLGTAACGTVSMAQPASPDEPQATDIPKPPTPKPPTVQLTDTIVRRDGSAVQAPVTPHAPVVIVQADTLPPFPEMPVMPAFPAVPELPNVPAPIFGDYNSVDEFEDAMEDWGERMEDWGERYADQFDADWEDAMEDWEDSVEDWAEIVEDVAEAQLDADDADWSELDALEGLDALEALSALSDIDIPRVFLSANAATNSEQVRAEVMRAVEQGLRQQKQAVRQQAQAGRQIEMAERQRENAERQREQAERNMERAERNRERAERNAERQAARHERSNSHSRQTITISGDPMGQEVTVNGKTFEVADFRNRLSTALEGDGLMERGSSKITLKFCDNELWINGRKVTTAQARRYASLLQTVGIDTGEGVEMDMNSDTLSFKIGKKGGQSWSRSHDHDSNK